MEINFLALVVAALVTLVVGFVWYGPLFGKAWMQENSFTEEDLKGGNMFKIFGLTFIYSFFIAFVLQFLTIHQYGAFGMIGGNIAEAKPTYEAFMLDYGTAYRTLKHGALHGVMAGLFLASPLIAINGLFERKSWKYILIHAGYWIICMGLMGAIVCGWTN